MVPHDHVIHYVYFVSMTAVSSTLGLPPTSLLFLRLYFISLMSPRITYHFGIDNHISPVLGLYNTSIIPCLNYLIQIGYRCLRLSKVFYIVDQSYCMYFPYGFPKPPYHSILSFSCFLVAQSYLVIAIFIWIAHRCLSSSKATFYIVVQSYWICFPCGCLIRVILSFSCPELPYLSYLHPDRS